MKGSRAINPSLFTSSTTKPTGFSTMNHHVALSRLAIKQAVGVDASLISYREVVHKKKLPEKPESYELRKILQASLGKS